MVEHDSRATTRYRLRGVDLAAVALLGLAAAVGLLAAPALPDTLQVHWTVGDLPYHGVEQLATPVALAVVPLVGAGVYAVGRAVTLVEPVREALGDDRWVVDAVLVGTVATVVLTQVLLVVLNLA